jgi:hypothetical protein
VDEAAELVVRAELERNRVGARMLIRRGLVLLVSVPLVVLTAVLTAFAFGSYGAFAALTIGGVYALGAGIIGMSSVVDGVAHHRRCTQELRGLDATHQLPVARLLR